MLVANVCIDSEALSGNPLKSPERQFTIVHVRAADGIQRSYRAIIGEMIKVN